ncbi:hypothetical protein IKF43_00765 [Candidatus Saccharibacteria bacterium]|nr:hypothetical protein [Candidatus Saccharibacteria bacterium]
MSHKLIKVYLYSVMLLILGFVVSLTSYLSTPASADNAGTDSVTLNLPVSCTIDGGSSTTHTQSVVNNQYYPNLGEAPTNFTMYCNDVGGYIIYARGVSDDTEGNTNLVGNNNDNIPTGVYDPNNIDTTTSSWSMKLSTTESGLTINSNYNNHFNLVPTNWTEVVRKESGTVDKSIGSHVSVTYDAYISGTQTAGTYTGRVKYVMLHPSTSTQPITLAEAFKNAGKQKIQATDPLTGESGEYYTMQDMTTAICNATYVFGTASELELVDTRDNKLYWVAKLQNDASDNRNGQCWMTENLDLGLETTPTNAVKLTSENTNLKLYGSYGYDTANGYTCTNSSDPGTTTSADCSGVNEVITWVPERATIPEGSLSSTTWQNDNNNPYSYDNGLVTPNGAMDGHGYTGNYYNWTAAIASNNSSSYSTNNTIAANSICPKGWRLPNAASMAGGYEFSKLLYAYSITKDDQNTAGYAGTASVGYTEMLANPLYFVRAGDVWKGIFYGENNGYYWSNAVNNTGSAYGLGFLPSNVSPAASYSKGEGFSIRCVAE